ncbi:PAS domain-containing protein [Algihabitans albus]|uniref:PAS domain-containing protein n=1 Tax=Algihabitans albus TaxID=2164067 RepID=UPI000E5D8D00|nr:PAS domain-containing protein [Algihabitans albus]
MPRIEEQPLSELYAYWSKRKRAGNLPRREDIDPVDIPRLLGNLMLLDVHRGREDTHRFRFRLVGTAICDIAGADLTGRWLDELFYPGPYLSYLGALNNEVVNLGRATYTRTLLIFGSGTHKRITARVICPLVDDGQEVKMIIAGQVFDSRPRWTPLSDQGDNYEFEEVLHCVLD